MLKNILIGIAMFVITSLLGWIGYNTMDVPYMKETTREKFDDVKIQNDRQDEIIQQEIEKVHRMEIEIATLKAKLDK